MPTQPHPTSATPASAAVADTPEPRCVEGGGGRRWYLGEQLHRLDGPAVEYPDGTREWWLHDHRHRLDGPAVEYLDGGRAWWVHGQRHRLDGPAIEYPDGGCEWWAGDEVHRLDGPALEYADGHREWRLHGKVHRLDGPAIEYADGTRRWWVHDVRLSEEESAALDRILADHGPRLVGDVLRIYPLGLPAEQRPRLADLAAALRAAATT